MSIVNVAGFTEAGQITTGQGPTEVFANARFACMGCTFAYQGYITNSLDDTVTVYESESIQIGVSNGVFGNNIQVITGYSSPMFGIWNQQSFVSLQGINSMGSLVANRQSNDVFQVSMINWGLAPPVGFPGPPAFRTFQNVLTLTPPPALALGAPGDITIDSMTFLLTCPMTVRVYIVTYPSTSQVATYAAATGTFFGSVTQPGTRIFSFIDQ